MNEQLDLTVLLKDCPSGMELDCPMYDNVTLKSVSLDINSDYPISIETECGFVTKLTKYGQNVCIDDAKCVIFPKGKTTWKGFQRPFVEGDILYVDCNDDYTYKEFQYIFILKEISENAIHCHCYIDEADINERFETCCLSTTAYTPRFATEEEKQKLFDAIRSHGYKWNSYEKKLEKTIVPKFKVGDTIRSKNGLQEYNITNVTSEYYSTKVGEHAVVGILPVKDQDDWILIPNKFNLKTLQPFDKVLVRHYDVSAWCTDFYSYYDEEYDRVICTGEVHYDYCVPYNDDTKHLVGKSEEAPAFYRYWED